jgi:hypothetical protein
MKMLDLEEFTALQVGDVIEARTLIRRLAPLDPTKLTVVDRSTTMVAFLVTFLGITLGKWKCNLKSGALSWTF